MPRSFWKGAISFGLVNISVRLYPATRHLDVRFRELDRSSGQRLRHQRIRATWQEALPGPAAGSVTRDASAEPAPGSPEPARRPAPPAEYEPWPEYPQARSEAVGSSEVVKGFEVEPNRYVTVTEAELASLAPERSRTIDIEQFVSASDVDPIYFDTSYYVVPDVDSARSFAVLLEGMRDTDRLALGWIVLRRKRHLAALRAREGLMVLTTMFHADEILAVADRLPLLPADLSPRERDMARLLIETLSGPFEPERYRDEYRDRLVGLLEERGATDSKQIPEPVEAASPSGIDELMAALQASVERARQQKAEKPRRQTRRDRPGA
jgi:DNA end-binding protein Ku